MSEKIPYEKLQMLINPQKPGDHDWFLSLLDDDLQRAYEDEHMEAVMQMLRIARIRPHKNAIREAKEEIARLKKYKSFKGNRPSNTIIFKKIIHMGYIVVQ